MNTTSRMAQEPRPQSVSDLAKVALGWQDELGELCEVLETATWDPTEQVLPREKTTDAFKRVSKVAYLLHGTRRQLLVDLAFWWTVLTENPADVPAEEFLAPRLKRQRQALRDLSGMELRARSAMAGMHIRIKAHQQRLAEQEFTLRLAITQYEEISPLEAS